jgi:hypothetical protein
MIATPLDILAANLRRLRHEKGFQTQQLAMADNPRWLAYDERFAEGLRNAGLPDHFSDLTRCPS